MKESNITFLHFCDSFSESCKNNFSYNGKRALFDYLEEQERDSGEEIELDPIALCCEFTEYENATEAAAAYLAFEGMTFGEGGEEELTADEVEAKAFSFLEDRTTVIKIEGCTNVIIQEF